MFLLILSTSYQETKGPTIPIDCPSCGVRGPADSKEVLEQMTFFFFIRLVPARSTWLTCQNCGKTFYLNLPLEEVSRLSPADFYQMLQDKPSNFMATIWALIALVASVIPLVGLIVALLTQPLIWKSHGWQRILSFLALIISFFSTFVYLAFHSINT